MKTLTPPALCEHLALIRDSLEGRIEDRRVIDQAIGEIRLKYALTREPAPCPHRELLDRTDRFAAKVARLVNHPRRWAGYECADNEHCGECAGCLADELDNESANLGRDVAEALAQPCAAPGEPSQEDFDGMQRWLDDALRTCRDDDHKRLKYLHADVRILAAARRWVARAAPGGAGELARLEALLLERSPTCLRCGRKTGAVRYQTPEGGATCLDCHDNSAPGEAWDGWELDFEGSLIDYPRPLSIIGRDVVRVYRRRAPEREGGAR